MSTNCLSYENSFDIVREISRNIARIDSNSTKRLFEETLGLISKTVNCDTCAVYETSLTGAYSLVKGYADESLPFIQDVLSRTEAIAADTMQQLKTHYINLETSNFIYFVPIKSNNPSNVLMFSFKKKLASKGVELLEAISDVLAVALDKLMLKLQLREQYLCTIKSLVVAIEAKDLYTQGHSQRVASYSRIIGQHLNMKENELDELEITGLVHDIGKIGISDNLLAKADSLTETEFDEIRKHPQIGMKILMPLGVSENVMMGTLLHHKRYDLKGYPCNMKIDKLPLVPAIIGVADAFDAMTTERTYKKRISKKAALQELQKYSGTQFDPEIVSIMLELAKEKII